MKPIEREANVEAYLRRRVKDTGGFYRKVIYQGRSGSPDDWCFFPNGRLLIVECKTTGEKPSRMQEREIQVLRSMGFDVRVIDTKAGVDEALYDYVGDSREWSGNA